MRRQRTTGLDDPFFEESILFSTWYVQVKDRKDLSTYDFVQLGESEIPDPLAARFIEVAKTGAAFPSFGNFADTVAVCDQFMAGKVDTGLLAKVTTQAARDVESVAPYARAFACQNQGGGFGMPMIVMVFGYPAQLADYMSKKVGADGMVVGISPKDRQTLRGLTDKNFTGLARTAAPPPSPAA